MIDLTFVFMSIEFIKENKMLKRKHNVNSNKTYQEKIKM